LRRIARHLLNRQPDALSTVLRYIDDQVRELIDAPYQGDVIRRDESGIYREVVAARYRLIFKVDSDSEDIEIVRVWHSSRREPEL